MRSLKKTIAILCFLLLTFPYMTNAVSTKDSLNSAKKELEQNQQTILQKNKEKEAVLLEVRRLKEELTALEADISKYQLDLTEVEKEIFRIQQIIESKKEEIVILQDKVYAREAIMKNRLIALQHNDHASIVLETLFNAESVGNFIERVSAVATLLKADKQILDEQQADLNQIEKDKQVIANQEQILYKQQSELEEKLDKLQHSFLKRDQIIETMQKKFTNLIAEIGEAEKEQQELQATIKKIEVQREKAKPAKQDKPNPPPSNLTGKTLYVTATAYSHEDTKNNITYSGYDIKKNPHMKLIAVDPGIIPLGSKVWVENYGVAIAGDTGGAIIGHKIDVLMPSSAHAVKWGRKTVKIIILN